MPSATVVAWHAKKDGKGFGFVRVQAGKSGGKRLYVHHEELGASGSVALRLGSSVTYTECSGEKGPVATGVSGAGVLKGEQAAKYVATDAFKAAMKAWSKAQEEAKRDEATAVEDGVTYTRAEFKELYGDEWLPKWQEARQGGPPGEPVERTKEQLEKRRRAKAKALQNAKAKLDEKKGKDVDGKWYTRAQFREQYGDDFSLKWGLAEKKDKPAPAPAGGRAAGGRAGAAAPKPSAPKPSPAAQPPAEKRPDSDGKRYTKAEFEKQYGGRKEWDDAEERKDSDGKFYPRRSFRDVYGKQWGMAWGKAERKPRAVPYPAPGGRGRGRSCAV